MGTPVKVKDERNVERYGFEPGCHAELFQLFDRSQEGQ
jgi:hypothetical protein